MCGRGRSDVGGVGSRPGAAFSFTPAPCWLGALLPAQSRGPQQLEGRVLVSGGHTPVVHTHGKPHVQYTCSTHAVHMQCRCTCSTNAVHMQRRCTCSTDAVYMQCRCTCSTDAVQMHMQYRCRCRIKWYLPSSSDVMSGLASLVHARESACHHH